MPVAIKIDDRIRNGRHTKMTIAQIEEITSIPVLQRQAPMTLRDSSSSTYRCYSCANSSISLMKCRCRAPHAAIGSGIQNQDENFRFVYQVTRRTCKEDVIEFFKKMIEEAPYPPSRCAVVADNHGAHHSHLVREFCQAQSLQILFLPSHSSTLNSIERL